VQGLRFVRATIATFEAEAAGSATAPCRGGLAFAANALACPFARKLGSAHQAFSDLGFELESGVGSCVVVPGLCLCRFTIKHCDMARRSLAARISWFVSLFAAIGPALLAVPDGALILAKVDHPPGIGSTPRDRS
jgi:hypothetical protein